MKGQQRETELHQHRERERGRQASRQASRQADNPTDRTSDRQTDSVFHSYGQNKAGWSLSLAALVTTAITSTSSTWNATWYGSIHTSSIIDMDRHMVWLAPLTRRPSWLQPHRGEDHRSDHSPVLDGHWLQLHGRLYRVCRQACLVSRRPVANTLRVSWMLTATQPPPS